MYHELLLMTFGLFLFPKIAAGCAKWASRAGVSVFVKAFMAMFKMPETIFSRTTYQYCKYSHASKLLGLSVLQSRVVAEFCPLIGTNYLDKSLSSNWSTG